MMGELWKLGQSQRKNGDGEGGPGPEIKSDELDLPAFIIFPDC